MGFADNSSVILDRALTHIFSILIVDDELGMQSFLRKALLPYFHRIDAAGCIDEAEVLRSQRHYDIVLLDINLPGRSGIEWKEVFECATGKTDVIFMTGYASIESTISALKLGATDFILKPFNLEQMLRAIKRITDSRRSKQQVNAIQRDMKRIAPQQFVGTSEKTKKLKQNIQQFAPSRATVLIEGESGTGKELVARTLHDKSGRKGPFVAINCSQLDGEDLERELFGFTDDGYNEGLFGLANGGTLYLAEIGDLPWPLQGQLLRTLERRTIRPVGSVQDMAVDVRLIVATSKNLHKLIENGTFRNDLYFNLAVLKLDVPPLRERSLDLNELVPLFTRSICRDLGLTEPNWLGEYHIAMKDYHWPGNVRELKNLIERCLLLNKSPALYWDEFSSGRQRPRNNVIVSISHSTYMPDFTADHAGEFGFPMDWSLKEIERAHISKVLDHKEGNKSAAAKVLGVSRKTLDRKFKEWSEDDSA